MTCPQRYQSTAECIEDVIGTTGANGYTYWSLYSEEVTLNAGDVAHIVAQCEVTNPWGFPVMFCTYLSSQTVNNSPTQPPAIGIARPSGDDVEIGVNQTGETHKKSVVESWIDATADGLVGTFQFSLIGYTASTDYTPGTNNWLPLMAGYGGIQVTVFRAAPPN